MPWLLGALRFYACLGLRWGWALVARPALFVRARGTRRVTGALGGSPAVAGGELVYAVGGGWLSDSALLASVRKC